MTEAARRQLDELYRFQAQAVQRSLARRVGRDAAEDIVSRAFVRLAEKLERESIKDAPAMLGTIVAGLEIDYYRRRDTQREHEMLLGDDLVDAADAAHEHFGLTQRGYDFSQSFDAALRELPDETRDAFILTELRGTQNDEAAELLGVSVPTVERRRSKANRTLREELIAA